MKSYNGSWLNLIIWNYYYSLCLPGLELLSNVNPEIEFTSYVSCATRYALQQNCKELLNLYLFTYL